MSCTSCSKTDNLTTYWWMPRRTHHDGTYVKKLLRTTRNRGGHEWERLRNQKSKSRSDHISPRPKLSLSRQANHRNTGRVTKTKKILSCKGTDSLILHKNCVWWTDQRAQSPSRTHWSSLNVIKSVKAIVLSDLSTTHNFCARWETGEHIKTINTKMTTETTTKKFQPKTILTYIF